MDQCKSITTARKTAQSRWLTRGGSGGSLVLLLFFNIINIIDFDLLVYEIVSVLKEGK